MTAKKVVELEAGYVRVRIQQEPIPKASKFEVGTWDPAGKGTWHFVRLSHTMVVDVIAMLQDALVLEPVASDL